MDYTIEKIINSGKKYLEQIGIEKAKFETILIAQKTLKKSNLEILVNPEMKISNKKRKQIFKRIFKRVNRKPISKILGTKEFFSNNFFVNSDVLDPRPESELIVDFVKKQYEKDLRTKLSVLDLGVGSGCLIISIFLELSKLEIKGLGVDISNKALKLARKNVKNFNLQKNLKIKRSNWFSNINGKFDLIVSNPPYIKTSEIKKLCSEVRLYDPFIALNGGKNGLESYLKIANKAKNYLNKNGIICLELGSKQLNSVNKIFYNLGYETILEEKDLQGINRVVVYKLK